MPTEANVEPLKKISLVDQMVLTLRKEIIARKYPADGPFPSEKELTLRFGTSRHTVRSALQALAKEGLIEIAHGKGNIVKDFRMTVGIDVFSGIDYCVSGGHNPGYLCCILPAHAVAVRPHYHIRSPQCRPCQRARADGHCRPVP